MCEGCRLNTVAGCSCSSSSSSSRLWAAQNSSSSSAAVFTTYALHLPQHLFSLCAFYIPRSKAPTHQRPTAPMHLRPPLLPSFHPPATHAPTHALTHARMHMHMHTRTVTPSLPPLPPPGISPALASIAQLPGSSSIPSPSVAGSGSGPASSSTAGSGSAPASLPGSGSGSGLQVGGPGWEAQVAQYQQLDGSVAVAAVGACTTRGGPPPYPGGWLAVKEMSRWKSAGSYIRHAGGMSYGVTPCMSHGVTPCPWCDTMHY